MDAETLRAQLNARRSRQLQSGASSGISTGDDDTNRSDISSNYQVDDEENGAASDVSGSSISEDDGEAEEESYSKKNAFLSKLKHLKSTDSICSSEASSVMGSPKSVGSLLANKLLDEDLIIDYDDDDQLQQTNNSHLFDSPNMNSTRSNVNNIAELDSSGITIEETPHSVAIDAWRQKIENQVVNNKSRKHSARSYIKVTSSRSLVEKDNDDDDDDDSMIAKTKELNDSKPIINSTETINLAIDFLWLQAEAFGWIKSVLVNHKDFQDNSNETNLDKILRSGIVLCELVNVIVPGCIKSYQTTYSTAVSPLAERENINIFIKACKETFHIDDQYLFDVGDLYNKSNFAKVLLTLKYLSYIITNEKYVVRSNGESSLKWLNLPKQASYFIPDLVSTVASEITVMGHELVESIKIAIDLSEETYLNDCKLKAAKLEENHPASDSFSSHQEAVNRLFTSNARSLLERTSQESVEFSPENVQDTIERRLPSASVGDSDSDSSSDAHDNAAAQQKVEQWLRTLGLEQYWKLLEDDGWDDMATIIDLTEKDLTEMGIKKRGHIKKFIKAVTDLKQDANLHSQKQQVVSIKRASSVSSVSQNPNELSDLQWRNSIGVTTDLIGAKRLWSQIQELRVESSNFIKKQLPTLLHTVGSSSNVEDVAQIAQSLPSLCNIGEIMTRSMIPFDVPIIIDIGQLSFKVGFVTDDKPIAIIPAICGFSVKKDVTASGTASVSQISHIDESSIVLVGNQVLAHPDGLVMRSCTHKGIDSINQPSVSHYDDIKRIFVHIFRDILHVSPSNHPVFIIESGVQLPAHRQQICDILFNDLNVAALYISPAAPLVLQAVDDGNEDGIVVDIGESGSTASAVHCNNLIKSSMVQSTVGGLQLTELMMRFLVEEGYDFKTVFEPRRKDGGINSNTFCEFETARLLKEKVCFVSKKAVSASFRPKEKCVYADSLPPYLRVFLPRATHAPYINIGNARGLVPEALFRPSIIRRDEFYRGGSLQAIIKECIERCPNSIRLDMWDKIVVVGGTANCPGLEDRLRLELAAVCPNIVKPKIVKYANKTCAAWTGAAKVASRINFQQLWVSKQQYAESKYEIIEKNILERPLFPLLPADYEVTTNMETISSIKTVVRSLQICADRIAVMHRSLVAKSPNGYPMRTFDMNFVNNNPVPNLHLSRPSSAHSAAASPQNTHHTSSSDNNGASRSHHLVRNQTTSPVKQIIHNKYHTVDNRKKAVPKMKSNLTVNTSPTHSDSGPLDKSHGHSQSRKSSPSNVQNGQHLKITIQKMNEYMKVHRLPADLQVDIRLFIFEKFATSDFLPDSENVEEEIINILPQDLLLRVNESKYKVIDNLISAKHLSNSPADMTSEGTLNDDEDDFDDDSLTDELGTIYAMAI